MNTNCQHNLNYSLFRLTCSVLIVTYPYIFMIEKGSSWIVIENVLQYQLGCVDTYCTAFNLTILFAFM